MGFATHAGKSNIVRRSAVNRSELGSKPRCSMHIHMSHLFRKGDKIMDSQNVAPLLIPISKNISPSNKS